MVERNSSITNWVTEARPGYLGKKKDGMYKFWDEKYGEGNWRIANQASNREIFTYEDIIFRVYVPGYELYFKNHTDEAQYIVENYSYGYDKDFIDKPKAFDIYALYEKKGFVNQFHHVAFNVALTRGLGYDFRGARPLQVREEKEGFLWSPGRIPCTIPQMITSPHIEGWWGYDSVEDFYQSTKVLQVKSNK